MSVGIAQGGNLMPYKYTQHSVNKAIKKTIERWDEIYKVACKNIQLADDMFSNDECALCEFSEDIAEEIILGLALGDNDCCLCPFTNAYGHICLYMFDNLLFYRNWDKSDLDNIKFIRDLARNLKGYKLGKSDFIAKKYL